jgi:hypothetical protein
LAKKTEGQKSRDTVPLNTDPLDSRVFYTRTKTTETGNLKTTRIPQYLDKEKRVTGTGII